MLSGDFFIVIRLPALPGIAYSTSGSPATDVKTDSTPASRAALPTAIQLTSCITAATPIVATAVCAMVLTARTVAAFAQSFQFLMLCSFLGRQCHELFVQVCHHTIAAQFVVLPIHVFIVFLCVDGCKTCINVLVIAVQHPVTEQGLHTVFQSLLSGILLLHAV